MTASSWTAGPWHCRLGKPADDVAHSIVSATAGVALVYPGRDTAAADARLIAAAPDLAAALIALVSAAQAGTDPATQLAAAHKAAEAALKKAGWEQ